MKASHWGSGGRKFESCRPDQNTKENGHLHMMQMAVFLFFGWKFQTFETGYLWSGFHSANRRRHCYPHSVG
jgi:hypothetical protein